MTSQQNQQLAIDLDYLLSNSKNIKEDVKNYVPKISKLLKLPEKEVLDAITYHTVNMHSYQEHYYGNENSRNN